MGILLLAGGQNALAVCTFNGTYTDATFVLPATLAVGRAATLSRAAVAGDVLYSSPNLPIQPATFICTERESGDEYAEYLPAMQEVSGRKSVYQTNVPGIGVRVKKVTGPGNWRMLRADGPSLLAEYTDPSRTSPHNFQVEFILTGTVTPGTLSLPSPLIGISLQPRIDHTPVGNRLLFSRLLTRGTTQVTPAGCVLFGNADAVGLPTIASSGLNSVGATAGDTIFRISMVCHPPTRIAYLFEGTSPAGMADLGVLANRTNTGDATGVGVQLLVGQIRSATPVTLNTLSATYLTTSAKQSVTIPFVARYYRTGETMTTGAVWARATFTMDYQ